MLILGIDPGSAATGYGLVESRCGHLRALTHGTITPPSRFRFLDRLPYIAAAIESLLQRVAPDGAAIEEDRKSTRLNSSHDQISYAVFCLKKKNNTHKRRISPRITTTQILRRIHTR